MKLKLFLILSLVASTTLLGQGAFVGRCVVHGSILSKSADYTALTVDNGRVIAFSAGNLTLPSTAPAANPLWCVTVVSTSNTVATVTPGGSTTINGATTALLMARGLGYTIYSDGTNYVSNTRSFIPVCIDGATHTTTSTSIANVANCQIPPNTIGPNGAVETTVLWKFVGTAGVRSPAININTASGTGGTNLFTSTVGSTNLSAASIPSFWNNNSTSAQIFPQYSGIAAGNGSTGTPSTGALNSVSNSIYVNISGSVTSGDSLSSVGYDVILYPKQ